MFHRMTLSVLLILEVCLSLAGVVPLSGGSASTHEPQGAPSVHNPVHGPEKEKIRSKSIAAPIPCDSLWSGGIPRTGTGLTDCLEHSGERIGGADFRVMYPAEWASETGGGWGDRFLDPASEAIRRSVGVFSGLGLMGSVTLVFVRLETGGDDPRANTSLIEQFSDEPCSVFIYPASVGDTIDAFRQVVAHELFHCFQAFNFGSGAEVPVSAVNGWWVDGSADYFSNVAYPDVNLEWEQIDEFDSLSETQSLTRFTYAASFFFQYLGNAIGNKEVVRLLGSLPAGGDEATQQAALRDFTDMDELLQGFAEQYLDADIMDTSGAPIPFDPTFATQTVFNASGNFEARIAPFTIRRREVRFDPALSFTLEIAQSSGDSRYAFRHDGSDWGDPPAVIECDDPRVWRAAYTSVGEDGASSSPAILTATVGAAKADCDENTDECLQGTWQVDDYDAFLQAALDLAGATDSAMPITYEGTEGDLSIAFTADTITYSAAGFGISGSASTPDGITVSVTIRLEGVATAGYDVIEAGTIDLVEIDSGGLSIAAETFVAGGSVGVTELDPDQWIFFASPTYGYACDEDTLGLTIPPLGEPVVLNRAD